VWNATPSVSLTASHYPLAHPGIPLSPLFATLTETPQKRAKSDLVTPLFSMKASHSSSLFVTLEQISPVFATLSKSTPGYTPSPFAKITPLNLTPLESILTVFASSKPFRMSTYAKTPGGGTAIVHRLDSRSPLPTLYPLHPSHCVPSRTGARFTRNAVLIRRAETSPAHSVSNPMSGQKAISRSPVTSHQSLVAEFRLHARKAPRV